MNREELIIHLYTVEKKSINAIRDVVGGEKKNVSKVLRDNGIEFRVKTGWSQKTPSTEEISLFEKLYKEGKSSVDIGTITGWSYKTVLKYLDDSLVNGTPNLNEEQIQEIKALYNKGYSSRRVAEETGVSKTTVLKFVEDKAAPSSFRIYSVNEDFFNTVDSEKKAYWLGYMYADGSNDEKSGRISLSQSDKDKSAVYAFKTALEAEHPVYEAVAKGGYSKKNSLVYTLSINSRKLSDALAKLGCVSNKTYKLSLPELPTSLLPHFIRGVFDGDGSVWVSGSRGYFSITGYVPFLEQLQEVLIRDAQVNKTKINLRRPNESSDYGDIRYGGKAPMKQLYDYLYKDAKYFLRRKKEKLEEILH